MCGPNYKDAFQTVSVWVCMQNDAVLDWSRPFEDFDQFYERMEITRKSYSGIRFPRATILVATIERTV